MTKYLQEEGADKRVSFPSLISIIGGRSLFWKLYRGSVVIRELKIEVCLR
jgi:hypothetical protein